MEGETMTGEILSVVETGPIGELLAVLGRLKSLPEFGTRGQVAELEKALVDAQARIDEARKAMSSQRERAASFVRSLNEWTDAEIQEATGYSGASRSTKEV
jgi:hypothetical protein